MSTKIFLLFFRQAALLLMVLCTPAAYSHAQSGASSPLEPVLADGGRVGEESRLQPTRSRIPESPVGLALGVAATVKGERVTAIVVTGITGVEQRLWIPEGMSLYEGSVEIADGDRDGMPEVVASGVRDGRVGRCTWSYRPALERYSSRAQVDFEADAESNDTSDE